MVDDEPVGAEDFLQSLEVAEVSCPLVRSISADWKRDMKRVGDVKGEVLM